MASAASTGMEDDGLRTAAEVVEIPGSLADSDAKRGDIAPEDGPTEEAEDEESDVVPESVKKPGEWSVAEEKLLKKAMASAEQNNETEALEWLQQETEPDAYRTRCGWTVLLRAAEEGPPEVVQVLLRCRADVHAVTDNGWTPLHWAARCGRAEIMRLLVAANADPWAVNEDGETPWDFVRWSLGMLGAAEAMGKCPGVLTDVIQTEGAEAVEVLESWMEEARYKELDYGEYDIYSVSTAHLSGRLQVIFAKEDSPDDPSVLDSSKKYVTLSVQNLFTKPEVQAELRYLPGLSAKDACHYNLLEAVVDTRNEAALQTPVVEAVVSSAWAQMRGATAWDIICTILTVASLCLASFSFRHHQPFGEVSLGLVAVLHGKKTLEEVYQYGMMCAQQKVSILNFENLADLAFLLAGWFAIVRQSLDTDSLEKPWMAIFSAMSWLRFLYSLRGEEWMGPRLLPILAAIYDTFVFFFVTSVCIAAAVHAYYNLQLREEPGPVYAAFMQVIRLGIFGDFDLFEFEGLDTTYQQSKVPNGASDPVQVWEPVDPDPGSDYVFAHALFYCTGVGVTILLMNLLVGVLGQNFEVYQDRSVILFQRARAKMLVEFQSRPWKYLQRRLFNLLWWMMLDQKEVDSDSEEQVSFFGDLVFRFSFGPVLVLLKISSARCLQNSIRTTLRRLTRCGILVLLLFSPVFFSLSTCLAVILLFLRVVFQIQLGGIFYGLAVALGYLGEDGEGRAEECRIWAVLREDTSMEDTRSLRSAMKAEMEMVTKRVEAMAVEQKENQQFMQKNLETLTNLVKKLAETNSVRSDGAEHTDNEAPEAP